VHGAYLRAVRSGRTAIVLVGKSMPLTSPLEFECDLPNLRP
jgi:hypothetical protein